MTIAVNIINAPTGYRFLTPKETDWKQAPAPKKPGRFLVRNKGTSQSVLHHEHWLFKEIHGEDYEWCHEDDL